MEKNAGEWQVTESYPIRSKFANGLDFVGDSVLVTWGSTNDPLCGFIDAYYWPDLLSSKTDTPYAYHVFDVAHPANGGTVVQINHAEGLEVVRPAVGDDQLWVTAGQGIIVRQIDMPKLKPICVANVDPPVCDDHYVGAPVSVNPTGAENPNPGGEMITRYAWDFGNAPAEGALASHTYLDSGGKNIDLAVYADELRGDCETSVDVKPNDIPFCDRGLETYVAVYEPVSQRWEVELVGSLSSDNDGIATYDWDFGDQTSGSGDVVTHSYAAEGVYSVTLTVTDNHCAPSSCTTTVSAGAVPICIAGPPVFGVTGASVQFDGSASFDVDFNPAPPPPLVPGTIDSYCWEYQPGVEECDQVPDPARPSHAYPSPGIFPVTLTVMDDDGNTTECLATAVISNSPNVAPLCNADGPYSGRIGDSIQFDGSGSSDPDGAGMIQDYDWTFGDGDAGSGQMPTHAYDDSGVYTVTLCVSDGQTQSATTCCNSVATISGRPDADAGGPYEAPPETTVHFDASASQDPGGSVVSYQWDFGDGEGTVVLSPTVDHVYMVSGHYAVRLCVADDTQQVDCDSTTAHIAASIPMLTQGMLSLLVAAVLGSTGWLIRTRTRTPHRP